jgi:RNA polymerase sigma-70 factor (ECF subfamily)
MTLAALPPHAVVNGSAPAIPHVEDLWREFQDPIRRFLHARIANAADADDLLQRIFLRVHQGLPALHDTGKIQGWIYQIARNAVVDYYRRRRTEELRAELPELAQSLDGEDEVDLRPAIRRMVAALPTEYRDAIVLTEFQGLSQVELAARLGISVPGAKSRVQRARGKLRQMLDDCCRFEFDRRGKVIEAIPRNGCEC